MAGEKSSALTGVALDDLIALTEEMSALVRAGVPLETGLAHVASDLAHRRGKIAAEIAQRMHAGESLIRILKSSPDSFPPAYTAVVEAGIRSGRLPAALEGLASTSRRAAELRRLTRAAIIYPLVIAFLAFGLFVASALWFQPQITQMYQSMHAPLSRINLALAEAGRYAYLWAPWIPLFALLIIGFWWYRSTRAATINLGLVRITPAGRLMHYGRLATFSDMLALLIDSGAGLAQSVVLAADASGDQELRQVARQYAEDLENGALGKVPRDKLHALPPLLTWLLAGGGNQSALAHSLRSTAGAYRRRAVRLDEWFRLYLPIILTVAIGGTAVVLYAVSMLGPWYQMLSRIAGVHS
jgi:general secretion pathway protein F